MTGDAIGLGMFPVREGGGGEGAKGRYPGMSGCAEKDKVISARTSELFWKSWPLIILPFYHVTFFLIITIYS